MPRALAVPVRQVVLRRWRRGQTVGDIAAALTLLPRTVRRLIHRYASRPADPQALAPHYAVCGRQRPWPNQQLFHDALTLRREHPAWGAGLIRVFLQDRWPNEPLPSVRTLQRWLHRAGLGPAPRGRRPKAARAQARRPHEVWQMDAVERIRLAGGQWACWLRLTDEYTGAILFTRVFAVERWAQVTAPDVQNALRQAFARWGRPRRLRVDNGAPWGSTGGLPSPLALWLLGLDVVVSWNRPRRPRDNAKVERTQGVSEQWTEPHTCADAQELQRRVNYLDRLQRERYPSIGGRSRLEAYPALARGGRIYSRAWEAKHWRLQRVLNQLTEYAVRRRVDRSGKVWLYDQGHWVGKARAGQDIYVTLDAETREWVMQDLDGKELRRQPARQLTSQRIRHLQVGRRGSHKAISGPT